MLKLSLAATAAFVVVGSAAYAQQPPPVIAELKAAQAMLQGDPTRDDYLVGYPVAIAKDLTGAWFPMSGLGNMIVAGQRNINDECENDAIDIDASNPFEIKVTRSAGTADQTDTYLNSMGGVLYAETTDVHRLETVNGYDATKQKDRDDMVFIAANYNGTAVVLRPSPNVLIIEVANTTGLDNKAPTILGRCND